MVELDTTNIDNRTLHMPSVALVGIGLSIISLLVYNALSYYSSVFAFLGVVIVTYILTKTISDTDILYTTVESDST